MIRAIGARCVTCAHYDLVAEDEWREGDWVCLQCRGIETLTRRIQRRERRQRRNRRVG